MKDTESTWALYVDKKKGGKTVKKHIDTHCEDKMKREKKNANPIEFIKLCIYHFACFPIRIILLSIFCMSYKSFIDIRASRLSFYFFFVAVVSGIDSFDMIWLACIPTIFLCTALPKKKRRKNQYCIKHRHRSITHFTLI